MNKFAIVGDSTCDLPAELRQKYDIDYARMMVAWTDKDKKFHEMYADLDWKEISPKQYYDIMRDGIRIITAQVTEQEFDSVFKSHFKSVHITLDNLRL